LSHRDAEELVTEGGVEVDHVTSYRWVMLPDIQQRLADPTRRQRVLATIRRVETEPSLLGASPICWLSLATDPKQPAKALPSRRLDRHSSLVTADALRFEPPMSMRVSVML
jgi:hypothetical protein